MYDLYNISMTVSLAKRGGMYVMDLFIYVSLAKDGGMQLSL